MIEWLLAPLLGVVAANVAAAVVALWLRSRREPEACTALDDEGSVTCEQCGAENEFGYRFCRDCVAELPGPSLYAPRGGRSRLTTPF